ncbi:MAG TPA: aromatic-ring-hydroxylating dioxygenase subunit beta [Stellaceae bacterium]|nr:aromatic-ring-hydroxylating dioxygenase subunit beta [Stellaceae bacterium]
MSRGPLADRFALYDLYAAYGALIDEGQFDAWLGLFAETCTYHIMPRENHQRGLPAGLVFCDSRAVLEDRIRALRDANKYNIHTDRHLIGLPRMVGSDGDAALVEAPFAVYQSDQEGETRLFATGLYRDHVATEAGALRFRAKLVLLDSFAVPSLLATPL